MYIFNTIIIYKTHTLPKFSMQYAATLSKLAWESVRDWRPSGISCWTRVTNSDDRAIVANFCLLTQWFAFLERKHEATYILILEKKTIANYF